MKIDTFVDAVPEVNTSIQVVTATSDMLNAAAKNDASYPDNVSKVERNVSASLFKNAQDKIHDDTSHDVADVHDDVSGPNDEYLSAEDYEDVVGAHERS